MKYFILFISLVITINLNAQLFGGMAIAQSPYVYDIDGNPYQEVVINTQTWLKPNLKTTRYNDGTPIPNVTDSLTWTALTTGAWVNYNNDTSYNADYGKLYNWYAVNTGNLCPTGYHVPSNDEWTTLTTYLNGTSVAGGKLKEVGTVHWDSPNNGATDEFGFTALPGGLRSLNAKWFYIRTIGYWWTSTAASSSYSRLIRMFNTSTGINFYTYQPRYGLSVRCLKD
jgi:uncharacterized protein (TIGR02145 family)